MSLWLQTDQASRLPPYASHQVGACGKVCACPYFGVWCGVCHFNLLLVQYVLLVASIVILHYLVFKGCFPPWNVFLLHYGDITEANRHTLH